MLLPSASVLVSLFWFGPFSIAKEPDAPGLIKSYLGHDGSVRSIDFSPDGKKIYSVGDDKTIRVWDLTNDKKHAIIGDKLKFKAGFVVIPDKPATMKSFFTDGALTTTKLTQWDVATKHVIRVYGDFRMARAVAISADGKYLICGSSDARLLVWDTATGTKVLDYDAKQPQVTATAISADSKRVACTTDGDGSIRVIDLASKKITWKYRPRDMDSPIQSLVFTADGKKIIAANALGTVNVHDTDGEAAVVEIKCHTMRINSIDITKDGELLATGGLDKSLKIWDTKTGKELLDYKHTREIYQVRFSPDGKRVASCGKDETVTLWTLGRE